MFITSEHISLIILIASDSFKTAKFEFSIFEKHMRRFIIYDFDSFSWNVVSKLVSPMIKGGRREVYLLDEK